MDKGTVTVSHNPATGGQKEVNDIRFDLIPVEALWEVARLYGIGARKYAANNWRLGYSWSNSYAAMLRHAARFWAGESMDEGGFHHLSAVVFHALALMTFEKEHPELDDRFSRPVVAKAESPLFDKAYTSAGEPVNNALYNVGGYYPAFAPES